VVRKQTTLPPVKEAMERVRTTLATAAQVCENGNLCVDLGDARSKTEAPIAATDKALRALDNALHEACGNMTPPLYCLDVSGTHGRRSTSALSFGVPESVDAGHFHRDKKGVGTLFSVTNFSEESYEVGFHPMPEGFRDDSEQQDAPTGVEPRMITIPGHAFYIVGGTARTAWLHKPFYTAPKLAARTGFNLKWPAPALGVCCRLICALFHLV
jgi:hypothetical protein